MVRTQDASFGLCQYRAAGGNKRVKLDQGSITKQKEEEEEEEEEQEEEVEEGGGGRKAIGMLRWGWPFSPELLTLSLACRFRSQPGNLSVFRLLTMLPAGQAGPNGDMAHAKSYCRDGGQWAL